MIAKQSKRILYIMTILYPFMGMVSFAAPTKVRKKRSVLSKSVQNNKQVAAAISQPLQDKPASNNQDVTKEVDTILAQAPLHEDALIEFNFENADLKTLIAYMAELFDISFITDDSVEPMKQGGVGTSKHKVTFRTEKPMSKKKAWNMFTSFLELAGLSITPTPHKTVYRITGITSANQSALPTFIGTDHNLLPDNDTRIRYITFLKNSDLKSLEGVINSLRGPTSATPVALTSLRALMFTDKSYNIKALMKIIHELDDTQIPEVMSVIKLQYAVAKDIKALFDDLAKTDGQDARSQIAQLFGARKSRESFLFPKSTRIIAEDRTNSLILLGSKESIFKLEEFIKKVDVEVISEPSPLYIYELQHTNAASMATILNSVTKKGISSVPSQFTTSDNLYFSEISFTAEEEGNRLIIKSNYEDYVKAKALIEQLDVMQPQVAIEVMIVDVQVDKNKALGAQIRNKNSDSLNKNVNFQNSGLIRSGVGASPVVDSSTGSIMTNLINLATGHEAGSTLMTLGQTGNIWAIFKALSSHTQTNIVSNPFLVTTNKYTATVELGETRRIVSGTVQSGNNSSPSYADLDANLKVVITPQINSNGIITLDISVTIDEFLDETDPNSATKSIKTVDTKVALANKEILAIGGLIKTKVTKTQTKVPILGDIPLLGWLFKNKLKAKTKENLLIFISPEIIQPRIEGGTGTYTKNKSDYTKNTIHSMYDPSEKIDPVHRWFFKSESDRTNEFDDYMEGKFNEPRVDAQEQNYYINKTTRLRANEEEI